ncbi:hypothetical protein PENSOL_c068G03778, partial [Penicillium solitum]
RGDRSGFGAADQGQQCLISRVMVKDKVKWGWASESRATDDVVAELGDPDQ